MEGADRIRMRGDFGPDYRDNQIQKKAIWQNVRKSFFIQVQSNGIVGLTAV